MPEGRSESLSPLAQRAPAVVRVAILRAAYAALALAFAALAASVYVPSLLVPGLGLALLSGLLLALCGDDLPKWAGIALLAYFALTVLVFVAATPITIDKGDGYFVNPQPLALAAEAFTWLSLAAPLMLAGAAALASWERELPSRSLLVGALAGFLLVGILSVLLVPGELDADAARRQGDIVKAIFAVSAAAGAAGAAWAAARPDEYA